MTKIPSRNDGVTPDEICACAHIADRLLQLGERDLALGMIEAIYCMASSRDHTAPSPSCNTAIGRLTLVSPDPDPLAARPKAV